MQQNNKKTRRAQAMKTLGIDHVVFVVEDLDQAIQRFSSILEMEFEEVPFAFDRMGMRIALSDPDGLVELISVIDHDKVLQFGPPFDQLSDFARQHGEGICKAFLGVKDMDEAVGDLKAKNVRIINLVAEQSLASFMPPVREAFVDDDDMPVKGLAFACRLTGPK
jgi:catechol 2,3-dioxygenase-like lactoylglutathione lyase family enzyme